MIKWYDVVFFVGQSIIGPALIDHFFGEQQRYVYFFQGVLFGFVYSILVLIPRWNKP